MTSAMVFFVNLISPWLFALSSSPPCEIKLRGLVDVGSGSTKLTMARVKVCEDQISLIEVVDDSHSRPIALEASKNKNNELGIQEIQRLEMVVKDFLQILVTEAKQQNLPAEISLVGTHAFRTSSNQQKIIERMQKLGVPAQALSQKDEAIAGYKSVDPKVCSNRSYGVWDIGGGSQQWVKSDRYWGFPLGAEVFKQRLMWDLKISHPPQRCSSHNTTNQLTVKDSPQSVETGSVNTKDHQSGNASDADLNSRTLHSPNPIGHENWDKAHQFSVRLARSFIKNDNMASFKESCIVGIGGVHRYAILKRLQQHWNSIKGCVCSNQSPCSMPESTYHRQALLCLSKALVDKSDCDPAIRDSYAATSVTNLFLVLGWMDVVGIDMVYVQSINIGHSLVTDKKIVFNKIDI
jgi:exopolyphosphatase / guanosine-5'-triphosphate,3'-diphosphate pyrophosphatase